jgi:glycerophosphoryl diester phosphodiesterase
MVSRNVAWVMLSGTVVWQGCWGQREDIRVRLGAKVPGVLALDASVELCGLRKLRLMRTRRVFLFLSFLVLPLALWWGNRDVPPAPQARPTLLAHRGIAQRFDERGVQNDTCTAERMLPSDHALLENTLPSIRASFEAGADIVEIDVHPTTDGQFAVFHDWTLECRTNGRGETRARTMAELKRLDVGHGYTADGGKSYPFRGRGVGLMPSLDEVLTTFPARRFLINVKSRDATEGTRLAAALTKVPPAQRRGLTVYGGNEPVAEVRRLLPDVRTASRASLKACLLRYAALGWSGHVPESCRRSMVLVPVNTALLFWGWPHRFQQRMEREGSEVVAIGPYGGGFTTGIDTPGDLARLPQNYAAGIWTNEIAWLARAMRERGLNPTQR